MKMVFLKVTVQDSHFTRSLFNNSWQSISSEDSCIPIKLYVCQQRKDALFWFHFLKKVGISLIIITSRVYLSRQSSFDSFNAFFVMSLHTLTTNHP